MGSDVPHLDGSYTQEKAVEDKNREKDKMTPSDTIDEDQVDIEYTVHTLPEEFKAAYCMWSRLGRC